MIKEGYVLVGVDPRYWPFGQHGPAFEISSCRVEYEVRNRALVPAALEYVRRRPRHRFYLVHYRQKSQPGG